MPDDLVRLMPLAGKEDDVLIVGEIDRPFDGVAAIDDPLEAATGRF